MPDPTYTEDKFDKMSRGDREHRSYTIDEDGKVIQKGSVTGEISPSGVKIGWKNTVVEVTDVDTELPIFTDRNGSSIHNKSTTDVLYLGPDNTVTADTVVGTTSGMEVPKGGRANFDIKDKDKEEDPIKIWGIAPSGVTILVKITEVA